MAWIDLNADLGEADNLTPTDVAVLDSISSVSIACGFHAGSPEVMRATSVAATARGVAIGAHVSYRDRAGFGRRELEVPPGQLQADIEEQVALLRQVAGEAEVDAEVAYVKPHGALYNRMGRDPDTASVVIEAARRCDPPVMLLAQAGTDVVGRGRDAGLSVIGEAFCDRAYRPDGTLVPRSEPGAVITDPDEVARRAVSLVLDGGVEAVGGYWLAIMADSLCVHGDSPGAAESSRAVRAALIEAGITIRAFAGPPP
ncbi:MAG TPA: 5-oxoprolinase subunit PxpA [Acidimicrobiales bacterium]|nr:5-oxoprolinase subunit PxpA [Acidimicrobiales bacterium]